MSTVSPETERLSKSTKNIIITIVFLLCFLEAFSTDCYVPALPAISRYFHVRPGVVQLAISVYFFGYFLQIPYGFLSDHYGRKKIFLISSGIFITGSVFCLFSENYMVFLSGRFLQGMGICAVSMNRTILCDIFTQEQLKAIYSVLRGIIIVVSSIAPLAGGYLNHYFGWKSIFIAILCLGITFLMIILLKYPETLNRSRHSEISWQFFLSKIKNLLKSKTYTIPVLCNMLCYSAIYLIFAISPFLFQNMLGWSSVKYGYFAFAVPLMLAFGAMINNILLKKFTEVAIINRMMWIGLVLSLILVINCLIMENTVLIILSLLGFSMMCGTVIPNTFLFIVKFIDKDNDAGISFSALNFIRITGVASIVFCVSLLHAQSAIIMGISLFIIAFAGILLSLIMREQR